MKIINNSSIKKMLLAVIFILLASSIYQKFFDRNNVYIEFTYSITGLNDYEYIREKSQIIIEEEFANFRPQKRVRNPVVVDVDKKGKYMIIGFVNNISNVDKVISQCEYRINILIKEYSRSLEEEGSDLDAKLEYISKFVKPNSFFNIVDIIAVIFLVVFSVLKNDK